jgi:hypothetical protein
MRPLMSFREIAEREGCTAREAERAFWSGIYKLRTRKRMLVFLALIEQSLDENGVNHERRVA